jgi:hypothetical protein
MGVEQRGWIIYELPYELGSGGEEIKFEGGLPKPSVRIAYKWKQRRIYCPEA